MDKIKVKKKNYNLLLINPPATDFAFGTAGLAYLKAFLGKKEIDYSYLNLNQQLILSASKQKKLKTFLINKIKSGSNFLYRSENLKWDSLPSLSYKLLSFSKNGYIYKALNDFEIVGKLFDLSVVKNKKYIGISVSYIHQLAPSLMVAYFIKNRFPNKKIILGGSLTIQYNLLLEFLEKNPGGLYIDFLVVGEGESALLGILVNKNLDKIPNLAYFKNGKYFFSSYFKFTEDFGNLPLPKYEKEELPQLQTSRACYYNRCLFCAYKKFPVNKSCKSANQIALEIDFLEKRRSARQRALPFWFSDSCLSVNFLRDFSRIMKRNNASRFFSAYLRFEEEIGYKELKLAYAAGFGRGPGTLRFGLETSSSRLLKLIKKGIRIKQAERIMENCYKLNIKIIVNFLLNLPTQSHKEFMQELNYINFLLNEYKNLYIRVNIFNLENNTYFYFHRQEYKIRLIDEGFDFKYFLSYEFYGDDQIRTPREARSIFFNFYNRLSIEKKVRVLF